MSTTSGAGCTDGTRARDSCQRQRRHRRDDERGTHPLSGRQLGLQHRHPDNRGRERVGQFGQGGPGRRRSPQPEVVQPHRQKPWDQRDPDDRPGAGHVRHPERRAGGQHDDQRRRQPDREPQGGQLDRGQPRRHEPAQHGAGSPEHGGTEREQGHREPVDCDVQRIGERQQPGAGQGRHREPQERGPQPLVQQQCGAGDRDDRLELLDHRGRHRIAVAERQREQGGGHRRGAGTDRQHGGSPSASPVSRKPAPPAGGTAAAPAPALRARRKRSSAPAPAGRAGVGAPRRSPTGRPPARPARSDPGRERWWSHVQQRDQPSRHSRSSADLRSSR